MIKKRGGLKGWFGWYFESEGPIQLLLEGALTPKGEIDRAETSTAVNTSPKSQEHDGGMLVPFAFGFVLCHLGKKLDQGNFNFFWLLACG